MKKEKLHIDPEYVIDSSGKKTAVILDVKIFEAMLEYVEDEYFAKEALARLKEDDEVLDFYQANKKILDKNFKKKVSKK